MQYDAKAPFIVETHWQIEEVLDGDSIIICNRFTQLKKEIRLYGLDAPEVKINRKMMEDEEKSSLPAELLLQLGLQSLQFVLSVAPPKTSVTIITELENYYDYWNRQLGYVILPGGECLNDLLLINGYAKTANNYFCSKLAYYQILNRDAQLNEIGIYSQVKRF
ncbi:thermonuclease family protein [Flavobacterium glaciei]|uniref:Micrococcal nuclease n=1 Tax=Flavobacterium glaciei TaxID=386300 RepID=A0A562PUS8_9FLAO|nr:thermonuclease family protein [Flavobacterium glaciei]RDI56264.1 micrococcal nuclease [Flavobacterium glaciei]TWI48174.1 micrococcal nuclease [Flavobacterium glaciei]